MKKKCVLLVTLVFLLSLCGTAFAAASSIFSDVPANDWSYAAVNQLAKAGIVEGYGDGTFRGERLLSRYEMAIIVARAMTKMDQADAQNKALIEKLAAEYDSELKALDDKYDSKYNALDKRVDNVMLSGFVRAKYDSDSSDGHSNGGGNKHFYMDLEGQMKVNDRWDAHFQSETNNHYTNSTWGNAVTGAEGNDSDNNGTIQRIWAVGSVGKVGVTLGKKWWGYGQNVIFGHAADGIQLDVPVTQGFTASVFDLRPSQSSTLVSDSLSNPNNTSLYGIQLNSNLSKEANLNLVLGGNHKTGDRINDDGTVVADTGVTRWGAADLTYKINNDYTFLATYAKTNADNFNNSQEYRLNYKAVDLNTPGSYDIYLRYFKFQKYGDISHDDEWDSMRGDSKGWILGVDYALAKNIEWTSLYSDQKLNISSTNDSRKLIRTEIDYHF
ncbi:S-layer homology domain-containing protein [Lucifera butyrica]|nr:S-layer homology domain-containing protein [Lucifera butyrica]